MKSFHTGSKAVDIDDVRRMLTRSEWYDLKAGPANFLSQMQGIPAYAGIRRCHFDLAWAAIALSEKKTLNSAVEAAANTDLFVGLAGSEQSGFISDAIQKGITADGRSTLDRIVVGYAGQAEEAAPVPDTAIVPATKTETLSALLGDGEEPSEPSIDEPKDSGWEQEEEETDFSDWYFPEFGETGEDADPDDETDKTTLADASAITGILNIVVLPSTPPTCRVELPRRGLSDSRVARLTKAFSDWLADCHPNLLKRERVNWQPLSEENLLDELKSRSPAVKDIMAPVMSDVVKRAWLFWPNAALPVRELFTEPTVLDPSLGSVAESPEQALSV
jgi:hypothetical protein